MNVDFHFLLPLMPCRENFQEDFRNAIIFCHKMKGFFDFIDFAFYIKLLIRIDKRRRFRESLCARSWELKFE